MDIKKSLRDSRGTVVSVDFLIVSVMLISIVFGCVDYWVTMVNIQQAEHVKNYYLDRSRITGGLSVEDQINLVGKLGECGFNVVSINAPYEGTVKRDLSDIANIPEIWLDIDMKFKNTPFLLGVFLGIDNDRTIKLSGRTFTEYIGE